MELKNLTYAFFVQFNHRTLLTYCRPCGIHAVWCASQRCRNFEECYCCKTPSRQRYAKFVLFSLFHFIYFYTLLTTSLLIYQHAPGRYGQNLCYENMYHTSVVFFVNFFNYHVKLTTPHKKG